MLKKLLLGSMVLLLTGSLAPAGELFGVRVESGVEIGNQAVKLMDRDLDFDTVVFQPYVQVSRFGNGPCFSARVRGLFGIDEDTTVDDIKYESEISGIDVQGLFGWGIGLPMGIKIAPVAGISFREVTTESSRRNGDGEIDYDFEAVVFELGAHAELGLPGKFRLIGQMTAGPVLTGQTKMKRSLDDIRDEADLGFFDGYYMEVRVGLDYDIALNASAHLGLAYERFADETDEFQDIDTDSEDELDRIALVLGLALRF